jgi:mannan endo-1,4-beta-mannosidase
MLPHADPGSWGIPTPNFASFANQFLADRAAVAHAAGKPYILEETGMDNVSCSRLCITRNSP